MRRRLHFQVPIRHATANSAVPPIALSILPPRHPTNEGVLVPAQPPIPSAGTLPDYPLGEKSARQPTLSFPERLRVRHVNDTSLSRLLQPINERIMRWESVRIGCLPWHPKSTTNSRRPKQVGLSLATAPT